MSKVDPISNIPTNKSSDQIWTNYFDILKNNFGKKQAKAIWLKAWELRGSSSANTNFLRTEMDKRGIRIAADSIVGTIYDEGVDFVDSISDAFSIGKTATYVVGGILILGLGMMIFNIAKNPIGAANTAVAVRTGGLR